MCQCEERDEELRELKQTLTKYLLRDYVSIYDSYTIETQDGHKLKDGDVIQIMGEDLTIDTSYNPPALKNEFGEITSFHPSVKFVYTLDEE